ncbi:hypothetical protein BKH44_01070 [Helicobacter sp. 13S00477-4]|nr:hypothetical protein BKH44_01070 [Helicobacter sp. 13S00477-4]
MYDYFMPAPLGLKHPYIHISCNDIGIKSISFVDKKHCEEKPNALAFDCADSLEKYFNGKLFSFDLPLDLQGTPFQIKVWQTLLQIKFAQTWSYKELALKIGSINYCRAVGGANAKNPIFIIVPCHRVIGNNGKLVGYAGGLDIKQWLLEHEKKILSI